MSFIAHRGMDNHNLKENTIDALLFCLNQEYISGVEFDIRITKDKNIIIYHDMLIKDNIGNINTVKQKNLSEIKNINKNIPTLEEFLKKVNSQKLLLIEIKEESDDFDIFIIKLFNILKKYKNLNIYICSFNYKLIRKIKAKYSQYKCGLIIGYLMNTNNISNNLDFYLYSYNYLELINKDKEIFIFTINKKDKLRKISTNINNNYYIISDNSYLLI